MKKHSRGIGIRLLILVFGLFLAPAARAASWSTPCNISAAVPDNYASSVAVDDSGNGVVVWLGVVYGTNTKSVAYYTTVDPYGTCSGAATLLTSTRTAAPFVKITPAGNTTAFWTDNLSTWSADKPAGGGWSAPLKITRSVIAPVFVMNRRGDAALMWTITASGAWSQISVIRRPAGGAWGTAQVVVSGSIATVQVIGDSAALGDNGDLVIAYETYKQTCSHTCKNSNYRLLALRQASGNSTWQYYGPFTGTENFHAGSATMDPNGAAAIAYISPSGVSAVVEPGAGQPWSAPVVLYSGTGVVTLQTGSSTSGTAVLAFIDGAKNVQALSGQIATNAWSAPAVISGTDASATQLVFAVGPTGTAVAAWNGPTVIYLNYIRAAVLPAGGQRGSPQSLNLQGSLSPESATINSAGSAIVSFNSRGTYNYRTVYEATYTP